VELQFDLVEAPHVAHVAPFRFAHHRVRGPYQPWARIQALDAVADALERAEVDRAGPAFGIYHDLPDTDAPPEDWTADLGFPVPRDAVVPARPGLRVRDVPPIEAAGLRYRGDLSSFPEALRVLVEWAEVRGLDATRGPLLERFHVSDALTGAEERDVLLSLRRFT
jgi:DNA gyrase inhibitor GyrI